MYNPLLCRLCLYLALGRPWRCWDDLLWCSDSHWRQMFCITESCAPSAAWRTSSTNGPARLASSFTASRYAGRSLLHSRYALICRQKENVIRIWPSMIYLLYNFLRVYKHWFQKRRRTGLTGDKKWYHLQNRMKEWEVSFKRKLAST